MFEYVLKKPSLGITVASTVVVRWPIHLSSVSGDMPVFLHYVERITDKRKTVTLFSVDAGAGASIHRILRTFPVNGRFTPEQSS